MPLGNNDNIIIQNNVNLDAELRAELDREKAKVKDLSADIERYIQRWHEASEEVERLDEVIAQLESDSGVDVLKERINELTRATSIAAEEFEGFLRYAHLIDEDGWLADDRLHEWFRAVKEGAITAGQAIANVKVEFGDFIRETIAGNGAFDSQMLQQFTTTLSSLSQVIIDIQSRLINMQKNGVAVANGDGLGGTFSTIDQIRESVENMSEEARAAYQPITQLIEKIVELTSADSTKILAISQAFRGLAEFGRGSYGTAKINNIVDLIRQLHTITSSGNNVIRFEMTGVNDLHVSKASMRNLAEYLPTIASVNTAELERLSHVDLTNFNDIKVSKVALDSIAQLRGALDQLSDAGIAILPPSADPEMTSMIEKLSLVKKLMNDINAENRKIQTAYSKVVGALRADTASPENKTELDSLVAKYDEYMNKLTILRQNKVSATTQDIEGMHRIQAEINEVITRIQARVDAENALTRAKREQKAADVEAAAALKASWETDGLTEGNIKSLFGKAEKSQTLFNAEELEKLKADYRELIELQELWKKDGSDPNDKRVKTITRLREEIKGLIETRINQATKDKATAKEEEEKQVLLRKSVELTARLRKEHAGWTAAKKGSTSADYRKLLEYANSIDKLAQELDNGEKSIEDFKKEFNSLSNEARISESAIKSVGKNTQSFGDRVQSLASKFSSWLSVSQVIMFAVRSVRQMITTAKEIDSALTQLRIVTSATDEEMKQFAQTSIDLSKSLGKSVTELIKSIETFSRLGYSLKDASTLAQYATILSNVAAVDTEEATTGLTSIIKGFNLDVTETEHVADILVSVGQKYAVSAGEMMEAYEKSGAALHASNTTLEKSAGLIAAANASVQDSSVVGTALKTISARIRGSKSDLEALGEGTEDLAEGFSKYAEEIKALTGFDIMVDKTHFKDLYDIFDGIAAKWNTLSDTQQARVAEILGGTRQLQVISSIMGNWKDAVGAYETATNSIGVSTKANDVYMESSEAHIAQLKATFEELSASLISSDLFKFVIDNGKTILSLINAITSATGGLGAVLIGGGLIKFISKIFSTIKAIKESEVFSELGSHNKAVFVLQELLGDTSKIFTSFIDTIGNGEGVIAGFKKSWTELLAALDAHPIFLIATAITAVIAARSAYDSQNMATAKNTMNWLVESSEEVKKSQSQINSLNNELETTTQKMNELLAKPSLTLVEQTELKALKQTNEQLKQRIEIEKQIAAQKLKTNEVNFRAAYEAAASHNIAREQPQWWEYGLDVLTMGSYGINKKFAGDMLHTDEMKFNMAISEYERYKQVRDASNKEYVKAIENGNTEQAEALLSKIKEAGGGLENQASIINSYIGTLENIREQIGVETQEDYDNLSGEGKETFDKIADARYRSLLVQAENVQKVQEVFNGMYQDYRFEGARKSIGEDFLTPKDVSTIAEGNSEVADMISYFERMNILVGDDATKMKTFAKMINIANTSVKEIDNTAKTSIPTFKELMQETGTDKNPSFVESIEKSIEKVQQLEDALTKFESGTLTDKERISLFKTFPELTAYANNLGEGIRNVVGAMRADVVENFANKLSDFQKDGASPGDKAKLEAWRDTVLEIFDAVDSVKNALDSMRNVLNDLDSVVKDYNENGYFSIDNLEKLAENGQRYLQYLTYENGKLKVNEEAYKRLVLAQIDEIETKATLQATNDLKGLASETAAKEYLAKVNIELASSQLSAAQAAFQYQLALKLAEGGNIAKAAQKVANNLNTLRNIFGSARSQVNEYSGAMLGAATATAKEEKASEKLKDALEKEQRALDHTKESLEQKKKALEDDKNGYEKARDAIQSLIEWTEKYIKQLKENEIKELENKKKKFDELVDSQKELLSAEKELHDYEKSLGEKQSNAASSQAAMSIASLDDSSAGKKAYKKAQEEYKNSQTELQEFLYEHEIETRQEALDKFKEDTDKSYQEQIDLIQDFLNDEVQIHKAACDMIDNDDGTLYGKLLNYCLTYTTVGKAEFDHMWNAAKSAMEKYNIANLSTLDLINDLQSRIYDVDDAIETITKSIEGYETQITNLKNKLDDLKDAAVDTKNALDAANSSPLKGSENKSTQLKPAKITQVVKYVGRGYDAQKGQYYYALKYNNKTYKGYVGDSSDSNNTRARAAESVLRAIYADKSINFNKVNPKEIKDAIVNHYANGTTSASGGISLVGENGAELRVLNSGDGILKNQIVRGLTAFGTNPGQFIADAGKKILPSLFKSGASSIFGIVSGNRQIAPSVSITVQGDATQATVDALQAVAKDIVNRTTKNVMNIALKNKRLI